MARRERRRIEDALKHLAGLDDAPPASVKSLAGHLGLSLRRTVDVVADMQTRGLVAMVESRLRLTAQGEEMAVHVVRAHRLIERYLADEVGEPLGSLHGAAERQEHKLSPGDVAALDAALGYPASDPHGDPIPDGRDAAAGGDEMSLYEWPEGVPACIRHIEDEPPNLLRDILRHGLLPGRTVEIVSRGEGVVAITDGATRRELSALAAGQVRVSSGQWSGEEPMSALELGESAVVRRLDDQCRGAARRRLLDLGLTPGARVASQFRAMFGEPVAYRIRGVTVALREDQARSVWVARDAGQEDEA